MMFFKYFLAGALGITSITSPAFAVLPGEWDSLPPEIHKIIISHLKYDEKTLGKVVQVNKHFKACVDEVRKEKKEEKEKTIAISNALQGLLATREYKRFVFANEVSPAPVLAKGQASYFDQVVRETIFKLTEKSSSDINSDVKNNIHNVAAVLSSILYEENDNKQELVVVNDRKIAKARVNSLVENVLGVLRKK